MVLLLVVLVIAVGARPAANNTIGSCRDGIARLAHARKTAKDLANNMLDAFVGLAGQYNRAFPHHDVTLAIFMEGYKEASARVCEKMSAIE